MNICGQDRLDRPSGQLHLSPQPWRPVSVTRSDLMVKERSLLLRSSRQRPDHPAPHRFWKLVGIRVSLLLSPRMLRPGPGAGREREASQRGGHQADSRDSKLHCPARRLLPGACSGPVITGLSFKAGENQG